MNPWHDVFPGTDIKNIRAIIEIPKGSKNKYELDKETGLIKLDRVLNSSFIYPVNYGFIPQTFYTDEDPVDVLVLGQEVDQEIIVDVRPIGILMMNDQGKADNKILTVLTKDPIVNHIKDIKQVPKHLLKEIVHFFTHYKDLEGKKVKVKGWKDARKGGAEILKALIDYKRKFKD